MAALPRDPIAGTGVVLRQFHEADIDDIVAAVNDPETHRFLSLLPLPYSRTHAEQWALRQVPAAWSDGSGHHLAVADPATDRLLGAVGLGSSRLGGHATSLGYWVAPWARRHGVATDATRTLASWAFAHGFGRIELTTDFANDVSQRVALAAGFTHEGVRRAAGPTRDGTWRDIVVWSRVTGDSGAPARRLLPDVAEGQLTDGVVALRPLVASDADDLYALVSLPEVIATTVSNRLPTLESARDRCVKNAYMWLIGARAGFVISDAATGAFAGDIGLFAEPQTGQAMVGYSVARQWRGRSFSARAARLVADWAIDQAGFARIVAGAAPDNIGSQKALEKAGFIREGYERSRLPGRNGGPRIDDVVFALLPSDRKPPRF